MLAVILALLASIAPVDHYDGSLDTIIGLPAKRLVKEFPDLVSAEAE